jgi:hypothetical protein
MSKSSAGVSATSGVRDADLACAAARGVLQLDYIARAEGELGALLVDQAIGALARRVFIFAPFAIAPRGSITVQGRSNRPNSP